MRCVFMFPLLVGLVTIDAGAQNRQTDWNNPFPPHKVIDNVHYVGSEQLGFLLITTPDYSDIADDCVKSFKALRSLPVDVFLGAHGSFYDLTTKYAKLAKGGANPFIAPAGFKVHLDRQEKNFAARLDGQKKAATK